MRGSTEVDRWMSRWDRDAIVVIPSHIPMDFSLLEPVDPMVPILIVDDSVSGLPPSPQKNVYVISRSEQLTVLGGARPPALPIGGSACRNLGHWLAYREGFERVLLMDNDCRPPADWVSTHTALLCGPPVDAIRRRWTNPLRGSGCYARGFPYEERIDPDIDSDDDGAVRGRVVLNLGLWSNILDVNGIDKLHEQPPATVAVPPEGSAFCSGLIPLCGMNVAVRSEIIPAYWFVPDVRVGDWTLSRHDDIWGGAILARLASIRGDVIAYGEPVVEHLKQTTMERVLVQEHYMHLLNPYFYDLVEAAASAIPTGSYLEMMRTFSEEFCATVERRRTLPDHYHRAFAEIGAAMRSWINLF
jgi:hypothetical protein